MKVCAFGSVSGCLLKRLVVALENIHEDVEVLQYHVEIMRSKMSK